MRRDLPRVASGVAVEAGWIAAHVVMYPGGLLSDPANRSAHGHYNFRGFTPAQRGLVHHGVDAAATPILLVHGIVDNHSIFTVMDRALRRRGFSDVSSFDYGLLTSDVRGAARDLQVAVEQLCADSGYERIHIIGHSLGGLIARYYIQRMEGYRRVHTCVTLGSPHQGTVLAKMGKVAAAGPTARSGLRSDRRADAAGAGLHDPVHRVLLRHRPPDPAALERDHRPPRSACDQRRHPRRRPHVHAEQRADRLPDRVCAAANWMARVPRRRHRNSPRQLVDRWPGQSDRTPPDGRVHRWLPRISGDQALVPTDRAQPVQSREAVGGRSALMRKIGLGLSLLYRSVILITVSRSRIGSRVRRSGPTSPASRHKWQIPMLAQPVMVSAGASTRRGST